MKKYISLFLPFCILLSSCELLFMEPNPETTKAAIFEEAWTFADREYSFFDFKKIDWDSVKEVFEPMIDEEMDDEEFFDLLADMLFTLRDGHVNLRAPFDRSRNWTWFLDFPPNYNEDLLERFYWKSEEQFVGPFTVFDFGDIGYANYRSFSSSVSSSSMSYLVEKFSREGYKGLIFDMRSNGGGSLSNVTNILGWFTEEDKVAAKRREKNGPGHNDFTELDDFIIEKRGDTTYNKPVIVLVNRLSYSATSFLSTCTKAFPNIILMGDTTGGGGGAPVNTDLANGWTLRVSGTQLFTLDGFNIEDGVPPDVFVQMDSTEMLNGTDTMLELALETLRK
ncbi:MAG: S41 family peptidase [Bacteroidia bacterium]|nr:S41 family peptidase [Bacteroidia bacterium]